MENSQGLVAVLVCAAPCVAVVVAFMAGLLIGQRGVPQLTWARRGTGKPTNPSVLKSRTTVHNIEEQTEG